MIRTKSNEEFPSCKRTYATLSFYHKTQPASQVTEILGVRPTRVVAASHPKPHGWFLTTQDISKSRDLRRHLFCIFERLDGKKELVDSLRKQGWSSAVHCYWESVSGNGGPIIDVPVTDMLQMYSLDLHFDIWFVENKVQDQANQITH